jgi:hypothetical protein
MLVETQLSLWLNPPPELGVLVSQPSDRYELVQAHDECDVTQTSPHELPVINICAGGTGPPTLTRSRKLRKSAVRLKNQLLGKSATTGFGTREPAPRIHHGDRRPLTARRPFEPGGSAVARRILPQSDLRHLGEVRLLANRDRFYSVVAVEFGSHRASK